MKFGDDHDDIFAAKSGFGGAEYLLPALVSEGSRRGLSYRRIAELTALNPAERYGLGDDQGPHRAGLRRRLLPRRPVRLAGPSTREDSESTQEYTPFEGFELSAKVTDTWVRGMRVLEDGKVVGEPRVASTSAAACR